MSVSMHSTVYCKWCGHLTRFVDSCKVCWELEWRITRCPEIARKILNEVEKKNENSPGRCEQTT